MGSGHVKNGQGYNRGNSGKKTMWQRRNRQEGCRLFRSRITHNWYIIVSRDRKKYYYFSNVLWNKANFTIINI